MATYVGSTVDGFFGSVFATLGVVLPSMIVIILILTLLKTLTQNKHFLNALKGIKPVVLGLIFSTGLILVFKAIGYKSTSSFIFDWKSFIILGIICLLYFVYQKIFKKKPNTILLIIVSACLGIIISII